MEPPPQIEEDLATALPSEMEVDSPALNLELSAPRADSEAEAPSPQVSRGFSEQLAKMENVLRGPSQLAAEQQKDLILGPIREALEKGE